MWGIIGDIASLSGIAGISITNFLEDTLKSWLAFGAFVLLLFYVGWRVYKVSKHVLSQQYPDGYLPLSAVAKWTTSDGKNIVYELSRHLQIKKPVMRCFDHRFTWTGSKLPVVSSDLQQPSEVKDIEGERSKLVQLRFATARVYNEVEIVHIRMALDDSDGQADPFIGHTVRAPIRLISFDVELLHADSKYHGANATVTRRSLEKGSSAILETITTVSFNPMTKSFFYQILNPDPGYSYCISWDPPANGNGRRKKKAPGSPWKA